ncbi:MlaD family protein [Fibrobacterales bacterium]|nr:MlaD family protein [Fibrobacterales bacterium]
MPNSKIRYLIVGFVLLLSTFILAFGMQYLSDEDPSRKTLSYELYFPQVGTLTLGDPVKANGVKVGRVQNIELVGLKVKVSIRVFDDVYFPINSEVRLQNIGLLGERQIGIVLGDSKTNYAESDKIVGIYDYGIAETMATAGDVFDSSKILLESVRRVLDSTIAAKKFPEQFNTIVSNTLTLQNRIDSLLDVTDPALRVSLSNLKKASIKVNKLIDDSEQPVKNILSGGEKLTEQASHLATQADSLSSRLSGLLTKIESRENTVGVLLSDTTLYTDVRKTLKDVDSLFLVIINHGLDINVDLF